MSELKAKLLMHNDTPQNWNIHNPILSKGEVGCAIDEATGIVTFKVGDGVHHWRDLEMRPGTRESSTTYSTAKGDYATLANMPTKPCGYSHAEGHSSLASGYCSHAEGHQTKVSTMQSSVNEMQEAMKRIQQAASMAGVSMAEAVSALKNIYTVPGNEKPVKATFEGAPISAQEALVKMAETMREAKEREKKNPYLEDFEIPHYDFEDMDIEHLIDF